MNKPKRDPEKELFRRKVFDGILTGILIVIVGILVVILGYATFTMIQQMLVILSTPQAQAMREVLGFLVGFVGAVVFIFILAKYGVWNEERIEELKKIVESEDKTSG